MFLLTITLWFSPVNGVTEFYTETFKTLTYQECKNATGVYAEEFTKNSGIYKKQGVVDVDINCTALENFSKVGFQKSIKDMRLLGGS